jgi:sulfoxide reductase heme-binding subunit YedZ
VTEAKTVPQTVLRPVARPPRRRWLSRAGLAVLGAPALFPLACMIPAVATRNGPDLDNSVADVLGTGAEACLLLCLLVTPLVLVTGSRWWLPLRKWYGIMAGVVAMTDAVIAAATTVEFGPPAARLAGHVFLLAGFLMVVVLLPVTVTSNNWSQRWMGRYWRPVQRLTYLVWGLLGVHLALLFNLGPHSGGPVTHQRVYQYAACSAVLVAYRLAVVRRAVGTLRKAGLAAAVYLFSVLPGGLFAVGFAFIVNEEIYKGLAAVAGHPISN